MIFQEQKEKERFYINEKKKCRFGGRQNNKPESLYTSRTRNRKISPITFKRMREINEFEDLSIESMRNLFHRFVAAWHRGLEEMKIFQVFRSSQRIDDVRPTLHTNSSTRACDFPLQNGALRTKYFVSLHAA